MPGRQVMRVEVLTIAGWYRGRITLPAGGRLLDFLNTKPAMIALADVVLPGGRTQPLVAINTAQVMAIRPHETES